MLEFTWSCCGQEVIHKRGEFRRYNSAGVCVSTNGAEGFFARVKRMLRVVGCSECVCVGRIAARAFRLLVWSDYCSWPLLSTFSSSYPKRGLLEVPKNVASFFHGSVGVGTCKVCLGHSGIEWLPAQSGITPSSWPKVSRETIMLSLGIS